MTCDGTSHDILPKKSVTANLTVEEMKINSFVAQNGRVDQVRFWWQIARHQNCPSPTCLFQYSSRYAKSGNNYVIFQVVNPTKNFVTLVEKDAGNKKFPDTIRTVSTRVAPYVSQRKFSNFFFCSGPVLDLLVRKGPWFSNFYWSWSESVLDISQFLILVLPSPKFLIFRSWANLLVREFLL